MDVKRSIELLKQAKNEIDQAIHALEQGDSTNCEFSIVDASACLNEARKENTKFHC